jgi:NAD(P)-dependent dehydrogenase (short-subunit alcohol dehydrogenase family)
MVRDIPASAVGLALAHHGLVVWGDDPHGCYATLIRMVARIEEYLETARRGKPIVATGRRAVPDRATRLRCAETLLPVVRGSLGDGDRVILHFDDADDVLGAVGAEHARKLVRRGVATPEHVLRAGRLPLWLDLDPSASPQRLAADARTQLDAQRAAYLEYHRRHATAGQEPLADWAKVVLVPGIGMITAFRDKPSALTANLCYRAVLETIANAETLDEFRFLPDEDVFAVEHWPLERRKVEEQIARERATLLLPRQVAVVIGGGSGIGKAAAERFAAQGAHVAVSDLDADAAQAVAADITGRWPGRAIGVGVDVRDEGSLAALFRQVVLTYGGVDCLFYTAGQVPRFAPFIDLAREDLQRQLDVHYLGAVGAMGAAARVMRLQQRGGAIVVSVSKAALAPAREALAYAASKAAILQAVRVAAVELGADAIRVNAINADQIDTPMFRRFVEERAAARGVSVEQQLAAYRDRNVMGVSLIPPDAVADLAVLLASDRFRYTTGDVLTVDGGLPEAFPR